MKKEASSSSDSTDVGGDVVAVVVSPSSPVDGVVGKEEVSQISSTTTTSTTTKRPSNPTVSSSSSNHCGDDDDDNDNDKLQNEEYDTHRSSSLTVISDLTPQELEPSTTRQHASSSNDKRMRCSSNALRESQVMIHDSRILQRSLHLGGSTSSSSHNHNPLAKLPWEKVGLVGRQSQLLQIQKSFQNGVSKGNGPTLIR